MTVYGELQMKNALSLVLAAALVACATFALATEVKTPHFTITLPADWVQPTEIMNQQGSSVALFQNKTNGTAVTITIVDAPMDAKTVAEQTITNMKNGGMTPSALKEENGVYISSFEQGGAQGISYFGSNGKSFAVTTIVGPDVAAGQDMLKHLKTADAKLIPTF